MHSLLEDYLSEVAAHLSALPVKRRNEELREMRAHLENAVIVSRELGQSEEDAAQGVVAQFGTPKDLGENLVWAWQRGENKRNKRSFWIATGCTFALSVSTPLLMICLPAGPWTLTGFSPLIVGMICGSFFWKRGMAGVALGTALYYYVFGLSAFTYGVSLPENRRLVEPLARHVVLFLIQQTEAGLFTLLTAWVASRLRLTWSKKKRLERS